MRTVLALLASAALAAACGSPSELHGRMQQRLDTHLSFALTAEDPGAVLRETEGYCDEMGEMSGRMQGEEGCPCCGDDGQMMRTQMQAQLEDHRARMRELGDLEAMRAECQAHRDRMAPMMGDMGGPMMGSGPMH